MATIKFQPQKKVAYDQTPLQLKVSLGVREKVMSIPGWQETVRGFLDEMIASMKNLLKLSKIEEVWASILQFSLTLAFISFFTKKIRFKAVQLLETLPPTSRYALTPASGAIAPLLPRFLR